MFSFSKKAISKLNLILDIKSSIVRGSLVLMIDNELPNIVWSNTIDVPYKAGSDSSYLLSEAVKAVGKVTTLAHTYILDKHIGIELPKKISLIHIVLSSPWIISEARTVSRKFDIDTKIKRSFIQDIINEERAKLIGESHEVMIGIEEKICDVRLNGYSIQCWEGNVAKNLEVSFALSLASKTAIQNFKDACVKSGLHGARIDFHSSLLLQHIGINSVLALQEPYLLLHPHGELTDIVLADNESCILFGSYPIGVRTIERNLMKSLKISESTADSMLSIYEDGHTDELHGSKDVESIQLAMKDWINCYKDISKLIPENHKPVRCIVSSRNHEFLFKKLFGENNPEIVTELLPRDKVFELVKIQPLVEKLRLTVFYIIAIQGLETL